ncbi:MAG: hypothetical protein L0I24_15190 [Pseudonocardia sp.]|nr:hypothetical protein [Pseudonocardia sp.]
MDDRDRHAAVTVAASLTGTYPVAVGAPVPPRGQERARRIVLRRLVGELHAIGVLDITAESRGGVLDRRDVELLRSVRFDLPKGTRVCLDHRRGEAEPLLWPADIIAGAVRATREGRTIYREMLADRLTLVATVYAGAHASGHADRDIGSRTRTGGAGGLLSVHRPVHELSSTGASAARSGARSANDSPVRRACGRQRRDHGSEGWGFESLRAHHRSSSDQH